jgi:putative aldouronate transport system substrate-binding protein
MYKMSRREVLVAAGATTLALAGCSSGGGGSRKGLDVSGNRAGAMDRYGVGDQFRATRALTFPILHLTNPGYPLKSDWLFWSELTRRTNVTLQTTEVPLSDYENKRSLLVGSGQAPLIVPKTYPGSETPFVASGAILPVSDYIDLMPNFKDKVARWNLQGDVDTLRQADGKYYLLPGLHQDVWVDYSLAMRTDVLQKLGLPIPGTWDQLHTTLQAMRSAYPGSYPFSDRWGVPTPGGALLNVMAPAYGTAGGWGYFNATWDPRAKKFVGTGTQNGFKQMLQYLHTLVAEKLMDPESFTQSDDNATQKFGAGKSLVISTNAQSLVDPYRTTLSKSIPDATIVKIPVPTGPLGAVKAGSRLENGVMILKKARDSENFVAMMQFIDWLWYSDAGQVFAKWGVPGVTYNRDSSGKFTLAPDVNYVGMNPRGTKLLNRDFGFSNGVFAYGGSTQLLESTFSAEEVAFQKVMTSRKTLAVPPPYPFTADEREQATLWETPLKDYVTQNALKFVLGQRDFSQWDAFQNELKGKNMGPYIDLVNKAYQRLQKKTG